MDRVKKPGKRYTNILGMYKVDLNYDGSKCKIPDNKDIKILKKQAQRHIDNVCEFIRYHAEKNGWAFSAWLVASNSDPDTKEPCRIHVHGTILANPAPEVVKLLCGTWHNGQLVEKGYWTKRYTRVIFKRPSLPSENYYKGLSVRQERVHHKVGGKPTRKGLAKPFYSESWLACGDVRLQA